MRISIIIPVYNKASTIGKVIEKVTYARGDAEIMVVDDPFIDQTVNIFNAIEKEK